MTKLKLSILTVLTLIITSSLFYSCSNEDSVGIENEKVDFLNELKAFNTNYQLTVIDVQEDPVLLSKGDDCGFWCTVGKVVVVAGADLAGAAVGVKAVAVIAGATAGTGVGTPLAAGLVVGGAVLGGAAGSIVAAVKVNEATSQKAFKKSNNSFGKKLFIKNLDIKYPPEFSYLEKTGELHNIELYNHFNGFSRKTTKLTDIESIEDTEEWKEAIGKTEDIINNYVSNNFNTDNLTKSLYDEGLISKDIQNVLNIFYDIYNNIQNSGNIKDISNFYINAISNSNVLSYEDKTALIVSFSVASESPFYWSNQN